MNDLNGLDWSSKSAKPERPSNYSAFNALKPTPPASGRASPLLPSSTPQPPSSTFPANDSFSNLVSFSSNSGNKNLSLQEQQKRLADSKLQQQNGGIKTTVNQSSGIDDSIWNNLGSGRGTPAPPVSGTIQPPALGKVKEDEDDMFAVFNTSIPAIPTRSTKSAEAPAIQIDEDDDPFGLSEFQAKASKPPTSKPPRPSQKQMSMHDDDDVLGLLGRPVSDFPSRQPDSPKSRSKDIHPQDKAIAELVDMGFATDKARRALESTESGVDVQAAVGILLNQAHSEAQAKSRNTASHNGTESRPTRSRPREDDHVMSPRREKGSTPSNDPTQAASDFSASFIKTAGSLWKQGQKRFQQAVQEYNSDSDSSQPKWMRDASPAARPDSRPQRRQEEFIGEPRQRRAPTKQQDNSSVTDEALMLEAQRPDKPVRPSQNPRARQEAMFDSSRDASRDHSPAVPSRLRESSSPLPPQAQQPAPIRPQQIPPSRAALSRQVAEDQASQAYVSSARRRKPASAPVAEAELLEQPLTSPAASHTNKPATASHSGTQPRPPKPALVQVRPLAPSRSIPAVSAISLKASHVDREAGNNHFKRGDYSSAHQSYSRSLSYLPTSHPIAIILLTNRALTAIKIGEPKVAVTDSDAAIALIGPAKGESETVDLTNGDTPKPMRDYYGKALIRKAEALEHMEKWGDAAIVWREAVESGHGGATAIQARQRAENAAKPKPSAPVVKAAPARPAGKSAAAVRAGAAAEKAAINKLRAQNAAAEKLDDERFQLSDAVDAKITAWRGGKQDNLRALLASLEMVLWPEAGWKKISMADLVLPNKVKIQYMKGIAKVHPDKIPTTATTEQRMIAGAVFSTLNEAWDKFKKDNNL